VAHHTGAYDADLGYAHGEFAGLGYNYNDNSHTQLVGDQLDGPKTQQLNG
jgi:hypothetical protein